MRTLLRYAFGFVRLLFNVYKWTDSLKSSAFDGVVFVPPGGCLIFHQLPLLPNAGGNKAGKQLRALLLVVRLFLSIQVPAHIQRELFHMWPPALVW